MAKNNSKDTLRLIKEEITAEEQRILEYEKEINEIKKMQPNLYYDFKTTNSNIDLSKNNITRLYELNTKLDEYLHKIKRVKSILFSFSSFSEKFEKMLKKVEFLCRAELFRNAINELKNFDLSFGDIDFGIELKIQKYLKEMTEWEKARVYVLMGETNIKQGLIPLVSDELNDFYNLVISLPTRLHDQSEKNYLINTSIIFICDFLKNKNNIYKDNIDISIGFVDLVNLFKIHESILDERALKAKQELIDSLIITYNILCDRHFNFEPNLEQCLKLFRLGVLFNKDSISNKCFVEPKDEDEFTLVFIKERARKLSAFEFDTDIKIKASSQDKKSLEYLSLGHIYAMPDLDETKIGLFIKVYQLMSFEEKIKLYATVLKDGISPEKEVLLVEKLVETPAKSLNLDFSAESLYIIKTMCSDYVLIEVNEILRNLVRSPSAHKYIVKSRNKYLHALLGEDVENPILPIGRESKKVFAKSIDVPVFVSYWTIYSIIIILSILLSCFLPLTLNNLPNLDKSFFYAVPFVISTIVVTSIIFQYYGLDEKVSVVVKKVIAISALWKACVSLFCFSAFPILGVFGYAGFPLLLAGSLQFFVGLVFFKNKSKRENYMFYFPTFILLLTCLIVMVALLAVGVIK